MLTGTRALPFIALLGTTAVFAISCASSARESENRQTISPAPEATATAMPTKEKAMKGSFSDNLPADFTQPTHDVGRRMLKEYGAMFVARGGAVPPKVVVFRDEVEVAAFQKGVKSSPETIGGITIELQAPAMRALKNAAAEAAAAGLSVTPRNADAAKRNYEGTVTNWASRVEPGLKHWVEKGRITEQNAQRIHSLSPYEQVPEIFKLEDKGIYFATNLSKSIIYSVAPPGTSQHLSMLALDVAEHDNARVRELLARHGWHQTVVSDLPHFTFLGVTASELPGLGLKQYADGGRTYWVPDI